MIGADATLKLVREFGGTRVRIPQMPTEACQLAMAIGLEPARAAAAMWGGDRLRVPLLRAWQAQCLNAEGRTAREIARALGVTETSVPDMLHGRRSSRGTLGQHGDLKLRQLNLFD